MTKGRIYLDHQATTPLDPSVYDAMRPYFLEKYGNPHALTHDYAEEALHAIQIAREEIASVINVKSAEIYFTSGATEANNTALFGLMTNNLPANSHIITSRTEHSSVLEPINELERRGVSITRLEVDQEGLINLFELEQAIRPESVLVSIMSVNNETGVIQPLADIGAICAKHQLIFHSDLSQALGRIPLNIEACRIGLASFSAHKIYGPKGIGAIYISERIRNRISPLIHGGGQERGLRSGTLPTPLCVGFAQACSIAILQVKTDNYQIERLRDRFWEQFQNKVPDCGINGSLLQRIPHNLNVFIEGIETDTLLNKVPDIAISSSAACSSTKMNPSHVLLAMGLTSQHIASSIRISFGRQNTFDEIEIAVERLSESVKQLRRTRSF